MIIQFQATTQAQFLNTAQLTSSNNKYNSKEPKDLMESVSLLSSLNYKDLSLEEAKESKGIGSTLLEAIALMAGC